MSSQSDEDPPSVRCWGLVDFFWYFVLNKALFIVVIVLLDVQLPPLFTSFYVTPWVSHYPKRCLLDHVLDNALFIRPSKQFLSAHVNCFATFDTRTKITNLHSLHVSPFVEQRVASRASQVTAPLNELNLHIGPSHTANKAHTSTSAHCC